MSKLETLSEFSWIKLYLPSTLSPIKAENKLSASDASSIFTSSKDLKFLSKVVYHSWSGFISPSPL